MSAEYKTLSAAPLHLSGSSLKLIACGAMLTDHACKVLLSPSSPACLILSGLVGRIAFPLFAFLLVEGFLHTRSRFRYAGNLLLFAALSEVPFDLALYGSPFFRTHQNTLFTLFLALLMLILLETASGKLSGRYSQMSAKILIILAFALAAWLLRADYDALGVGAVAAMYLLWGWGLPAPSMGCLILNLASFANAGAFLSLLPIACYNGRRGMKVKYAFYFFYPAHLLALYGLKLLM